MKELISLIIFRASEFLPAVPRIEIIRALVVRLPKLHGSKHYVKWAVRNHKNMENRVFSWEKRPERSG